MRKLITTGLISAGLAATVPFAFAQTAGEAAQAPRQQHAHRPHHEKHAFGLPSERVEARLAYAKTALKITDAQRDPWDAYAGVLRKHAKELDARIEKRRTQVAQRGERTRPTAIERMERRQQRLAAASARLQELLEAGKPLYAALSPEQQAIADRLLAPRSEGRHRHGRMHGRA